MNLLMVFLGGGLGSLCRFALSKCFANTSIAFPLATISANIISCFLAGIFLGFFIKNGQSHTSYLLLIVGFCGGFSTFSSFSIENYHMLQSGQYLLLAGYIISSVVICLISIFLGIKLFDCSILNDF